MVKPGSTTTSTVVFGLGMASSPLYVSRSLTQRPTCTSSVVTSMVARTLSERGVPGRPTSTVCRWRAPLASENERMNPVYQSPLATSQHDQTLFASSSSWFSSFSTGFHASFLFRCLLITLFHHRHAFCLSFASSTLLYVYTKYVSCLSLPLTFS